MARSEIFTVGTSVDPLDLSTGRGPHIQTQIPNGQTDPLNSLNNLTRQQVLLGNHGVVSHGRKFLSEMEEERRK